MPRSRSIPSEGESWSAEEERLARQDATIASSGWPSSHRALLLLFAIRSTLSGWWLLVPVAAFIPLLKRHDRIIRARQAAARLAAFYEHGMARLEDRWTGTGDTGERFVDDTHLYAADLDLFGPGSLFELLSLARTRAGGTTLAAWLKEAATPSMITARHAAVNELRPAPRIPGGAHARRWQHPGGGASGSSDRLGHRAGALASISHQRAVVLALTVIFPHAARAGVDQRLDPSADRLHSRCARSTNSAKDGISSRCCSARIAPPASWTCSAPALILLERESLSSAALTDLQSRLRESRVDASAAIRRLARVVEMHDWAHNIVFGRWPRC